MTLDEDQNIFHINSREAIPGQKANDLQTRKYVHAVSLNVRLGLIVLCM